MTYGLATRCCSRSRTQIRAFCVAAPIVLLGEEWDFCLIQVMGRPRIHGDGDCLRGCAAGRPGGTVRGARVPVLWITGPAGVGKSAVSWHLFTELAGSGTRVAFADADQLCICYPAPPDDPGRDRIRARNASLVMGNYQVADARRMIVNGIVDPALGVQPDLIEHAAVMVCQLRADPEEVVRRLAGRDRRGRVPRAAMERVPEGCDRMDASGWADVCVDTTGVPAGCHRLLRARRRPRAWRRGGLQQGAELGDAGAQRGVLGEQPAVDLAVASCPRSGVPGSGEEVDVAAGAVG